MQPFLHLLHHVRSSTDMPWAIQLRGPVPSHRRHTINDETLV